MLLLGGEESSDRDGDVFWTEKEFAALLVLADEVAERLEEGRKKRYFGDIEVGH